MKSVPTELEPMVELDRLGALAFRDLSVFAHDEHRFVLPIAHFGQQQGFLPSPCRVILLDRHSDAVAPRGSRARSAIPQLRTTGFTSEDLLDLTRDDLSGLDDDWLLAGMELGIFSDAVVFGVRETSTDFGLTAFNDHVGQRHSLWIDSGLPGECFGFQGDLCDVARTDALHLSGIFLTGRSIAKELGSERTPRRSWSRSTWMRSPWTGRISCLRGPSRSGRDASSSHQTAAKMMLGAANASYEICFLTQACWL